MLIAMAGLPGSGKTTLAVSLAGELGGVVLSKDAVRAALFPPPVLDYSHQQDDLCMEAVYQAARLILQTSPHQSVLLDGRTFLRSYQVRDLLGLAAEVGQSPFVIECVCDDKVARVRLQRAEGRHVAGNRTYELHQTLKAQAEPITAPHLVIDTGKMDVEECVRLCLAYVRGG